MNTEQKKLCFAKITGRSETGLFSRFGTDVRKQTSMDLGQLEQDFCRDLAQIGEEQGQAALAELKAVYLGKKGRLRSLTQNMKELSIEEKRELGRESNRLKDLFEEQLKHKQQSLDKALLEQKLSRDWFDFSLSEHYLEDRQLGGAMHPVSAVQQELEDIFLSMGFQILDGPHIEDEYHNFEALNIPESHPARDMQDTFWFRDMQHLLRTHTSCIQVRGMEAQDRPPFRFVAPGKVFRCEATDASHEAVFHQMEGMMVAEELSVAHLIYFMKQLLTEIFQQQVEIRLRPGYFPFVEPGFELDIACLVCEGRGCSVCKRTGWLELLPCGMVHPRVLEYGGIDSRNYRGFAFGLGLDRLVMMRYRINDIRYLHSGNLAFLQQFRSY
ncbi:phenylalanine--tRNA ligase subunit alpha [Candidatus Haliotispira prima]|uniref:Phenylalanine--tRNA ligase alpha subunit n=1 Tax=Candidatus Haliotispira prima TaxID=3034016 RepID=A0ABY8MKX1_9SPIO|nr:phenylalanine--tRNA ligase subunit alpha [Candidatus Haliotispira prima]